MRVGDPRGGVHRHHQRRPMNGGISIERALVILILVVIVVFLITRLL